MKIVIIGAVAAGTSAAAKARRNSEADEIVIYEKDTDISYSVCGLPYYIGAMGITRAQLVPRTPQWFEERYHLKIHIAHEVLQINPHDKKLQIRELKTGKIFQDHYDQLILATGAFPRMPEVPGIDLPHVFALRNVKSADDISRYIQNYQPRTALIIGAGFIGLEMLENLVGLNIRCTLLEATAQVMPGLDEEISAHVRRKIQDQGVEILLEDQLAEIISKGADKYVQTQKGKKCQADLVIVCAGVIPNTALAEKAGVILGRQKAIQVDSKMRTSVKDIYAAGDCAEVFSVITGETNYRPLGSTANKTGRIAGDCATRGSLEFKGVLGTGICRIFDLTVAQTGLSQNEAVSKGYQVQVIHNIKFNQTDYFPDSKQMLIKAVADKNTGKLLGAQIVGKTGVDKRIDVLATAITFGARVQDLAHLDLAYAPPYATTKDPVIYTGMILDNAINRGRKIMTPQELRELRKGENIFIMDVRSQNDYQQGHIPGAINIPLEKIRNSLNQLNPRHSMLVYCNTGTTGNAAQNLLINLGFQEVYNLSGGYKNYSGNIF